MSTLGKMIEDAKNKKSENNSSNNILNKKEKNKSVISTNSKNITL